MARTGDCGSPDVGSTPIHRTNLSHRATGEGKHKSGVVLSANCRLDIYRELAEWIRRWPLDPATQVRFLDSLPLAAGAIWQRAAL